MIEIETVSENKIDLLSSFLKSVPTIKDIDEGILKNASIVTENNKIIGCVSFEEYDHSGLIRYFVFKKALKEDYLQNLFKCMENNALKKNITNMFCVIQSDEIFQLFSNLGYKSVNKELLFIDETLVEETSFKKSDFMKKELVV